MSRQDKCLKSTVSRYISAANIKSLDPPTLIKYTQLHAADKTIWDAAYNEEYDGLQRKPTWITLTQEEFDKIKHTINGILPSMAISTIKYSMVTLSMICTCTGTSRNEIHFFDRYQTWHFT